MMLNEVPCLETLEVLCPRCGGHCGEPGANFGDYGFHPCYFCGMEGSMDFYASLFPEDPEDEHGNLILYPVGTRSNEWED